MNDIKISSNRSFGLVFFVVFLIISLYPIFKGGDLRVWYHCAVTRNFEVDFADEDGLKWFINGQPQKRCPWGWGIFQNPTQSYCEDNPGNLPVIASDRDSK